MERDLNTMGNIMETKAREIFGQEAPELTAEVRVLAEGKRFTFDIIDTPVDPLR